MEVSHGYSDAEVRQGITMTFAEYLREVAAHYEKYKAPSQGNVRLGQAFVNCLPIRMYEALAEGNKEIDPFYNDGNLAQFLVWAEISWEDE